MFLIGKALGEGNQWYFYSRRTQNRITSNGYWKAMGIEEDVINSRSKKVGMKKYLVFYIGEGPAAIKTNWIMQEYRLSKSDSSSTKSSKRRGHSKIVSINFIYKIRPTRSIDLFRWYFWYVRIIASGLYVEFMKEIVVKTKMMVVMMMMMEHNCHAWMKCFYLWMIWMK